MIKIQTLINLRPREVSHEALDTLMYVADEYDEPEGSGSREDIKAKIKIKVKYAIEHDYQAYKYLKDHTQGNFEEAIKAGETDVIGIARFYLIKELYEKLEEISGE